MTTEANTVLSDEQIAEIEARAEAATKGDWTIRGASWWDGGVQLAGYGIRFVESGETYSGWDARTNFTPDTPEGAQASTDRAFIAHARVDIPALCRTVKALRAEIVTSDQEWQSRLAEVERERETLIYWLLRVYQSGHREGWESSPSTDETMDSLLCVLANRGFDPNLSADAQELLKQKPRH